MQAMAELGDGPYRSGAVATKLGKSSAALSQLRDRLINKGLIYATEDFGHLDFSVPRFDCQARSKAGPLSTVENWSIPGGVDLPAQRSP
jgi:hypothetical protein